MQITNSVVCDTRECMIYKQMKPAFFSTDEVCLQVGSRYNCMTATNELKLDALGKALTYPSLRLLKLLTTCSISC